MSQDLTAISSLVDPTVSLRPVAAPDLGSQTGQNRSVPPAQAPQKPGDALRYSVEPGLDKFVLVFKVVDSATNRILSQTPCGSPQSVSQDPLYRSGALIDQSL